MQFNKWIENTEGRKLILTDRIMNGNRLLRKYNKEKGKDIVGAKCLTLQQIAEEFLCAYTTVSSEEKSIEVAGADSCAYVMNELIRTHSFSFIPQESICVQTAESILQSINQIRMNRPTEAYLNATEQKVADIKEIICLYEDALTNNGQCDIPLLLKQAMEVLDKIDKDEFLLCMPHMLKSNFAIMADYELTVLEEALVNRILDLLGKELTVLEFYGEETGQRDVKYEFFSAYGIVNEIDYVIERIVKERIPFGNVNLSYTEDGYETFIEGALESKGIPYSYLTGKKATDSDVVQFVLSILEWAKDDFLYEKLSFVVDNPLMTFGNIVDKENEVTKTNPVTCYNHYLPKGIGWGKERYIDCVNRVKADSEAEAKYVYFNEFLMDLIGAFEEIANCGAVYEKLVAVCDKYLTKVNRSNNETIRILKEQIHILKQVGVQDGAEASLRFIREHLKGLSIKSSEDSAAVNVIKVGKLEVLERPYNFIIGLSAKQFAADVKESPVLSDEELLRYIEGKITVSKDISIRKRENLERSLETLYKGSIIMGYTIFDTVDLKESSPSVFYIDYYEKYGNGKQDYHTYQVDERPIITAAASIWDWAEQDVLPADEEITKSDSEETDEVDEFDVCENYAGEEDYDDYEIDDDDRTVVDVTMSPSALQTLLACPLKYQYSYAEMLPKRDFHKKDDSSWLNPAAKGNLFHYTMEQYCNDVYKTDEITQPDLSHNLFEEIYEDVVQKMLEERAYTSKVVFEKEKAEWKDAIREFLCDFQKDFYQDNQKGKKWRILGSEVDFKDIEYYISGQDPDNDIDVNIHFKGSIDRLDGYVDADGKLCLRIADYKTGDQKKKVKEIKENKQIQHYVYAWAALEYVESHKEELEQLFGCNITSVVIEKAEYVFPYEKKNERFIDVTAVLKGAEQNGSYFLPEDVENSAWNALAFSQYEDVKECLEQFVPCTTQKELDNFCKYCTYKRQCRLWTGSKY